MILTIQEVRKGRIQSFILEINICMVITPFV